jgi:hypothetical protein
MNDVNSHYSIKSKEEAIIACSFIKPLRLKCKRMHFIICGSFLFILMVVATRMLGQKGEAKAVSAVALYGECKTYRRVHYTHSITCLNIKYARNFLL